MASTERNEHQDSAAHVDDANPQGLDPRDTDHPTGSPQADENAENDPPS